MTTTATSSDVTAPAIGGSGHFLLRRLHSLTGLLFGGYLIVHLLVNATLIEGGNIYQMQVDKIHSLPLLIAVEWALIFLPLLFHIVYGTWITVTGQPNNGSYPYFRNGFYLLQRISAVILIAFIAFHVLGMKGLLGVSLSFDSSNATASVAHHFHSHWWIGYVIYPIGILASCYHLANGFWAAAITWGLTVSADAQRRWGWVCTGIFAFTLACSILALIAVIADKRPV